MSKIPLFLLAFFVSLSANCQINKLERLLSDLPGVDHEKVETNEGFESTYILKINQPIDHFDTTKGFFFQRVFLSHKGLDSPSVMVTEGYRAFKKRVYEPTKLLRANQISVEHRYYGSSFPDSIDYRYLNMRQAAADLHHIRQLFGSIYPGKWISTGGSKGGVTTIFYRYFYPKDVDASIAYVAPMKTSFEELRIYDFLKSVGSEFCRKSIESFQVRLLKRRHEILPLLESYSLERKERFEMVSLNKAFEYAVMEYSFAFWQWGASCDEIPSDSASIEKLVSYLISISSPFWYSDQSIKKSRSHNYQIATELGYYGYETGRFKELLIDLPTDRNPMGIFLSPEMPQEFNGSLLKDVNCWLKDHGNKFIYVYGEIDPWSAAAVPRSDKVDSEWFIMKGKHHGSARIANMTEAERERLVSSLERWLSINIE